MAASSLIRSDSYLGARYRSLRTRLGAGKAIKAMARYLACLVYRMFTHGQDWVDRGTKDFGSKRTKRELWALQRKANILGYTIVAETQSA
jgi:transposase